MIVFALPLLLLSQSFPRPLPVGLQVTPTTTFGYPKASATFATGQLPFEMIFDCTYDPSKNGCWATGTIDFNTKVGGLWIYLPRRPLWHGSQSQICRSAHFGRRDLPQRTQFGAAVLRDVR